MKTLFSRILLAQFVTVVLALAVVTIITRYSLHQGFRDFLESQESTVLSAVVPVLTDAYGSQGNWDFLRSNPRNWQRIWFYSHEREGQRPRRGAQPRGMVPPPGPTPESMLRMKRPFERGALRERLFLLDEERERVAGAGTELLPEIPMEKLEWNGQLIGWVGFAPIGEGLPREAERFLDRQIRIMALSLALALAAAAIIAFFLARNVSNPFRELGNTVRRLSSGDFGARAPAEVHDEAGRLAAHVNQLAESLEKNRTARQRWMADVAHELRTPLAVLKGEIEALADGVRTLDEPFALSLTEEADHLAVLVDDLQALALADAGALTIQTESVDLSGIVGHAADTFRDRLAGRDVTLEVVDEGHVELRADPHRMRQLVHNLLENSCRYAEDNGNIRMQLSSNGDVTLVIEDSGPGVNDEQLERLFLRFYRVEGGRSRSKGGSGLGLSICRSIVEAHRGKISAAHSPLGGLMVRVSLPRTAELR